jgi:hypothetical protein
MYENLAVILCINTLIYPVNALNGLTQMPFCKTHQPYLVIGEVVHTFWLAIMMTD